MSYRAQTQREIFIDTRLRSRRDFPSAPQLAGDYFQKYGDEVSARTIKRDIERMRERRAPIAYDSSKHGYYYTHEDYSLPAIRLSEGDLLAIMVSERALASYRNSPYYRKLSEVFDSLAELLPEHVTVQSRELAEEVTVIPDPVTTIDAKVWKVLQEALEQRLSLNIHYRAPGHREAAIRKVDPYHVVGFRGEWYLLAWSHHDEEVRIYALARIEKCRKLRSTFEVDADFRPEAYIDPNFGVFTNEEPIDVEIRFEPAVASQIAERSWHPGQTIEEKRDGGIVLRYTTNQQSMTLYWVSQWGPNAEILAPAALRARAAKWFSEAAKRYS
jgi:proteasome accessory factor B